MWLPLPLWCLREWAELKAWSKVPITETIFRDPASLMSTHQPQCRVVVPVVTTRGTSCEEKHVITRVKTKDSNRTPMMHFPECRKQKLVTTKYCNMLMLSRKCIPGDLHRCNRLVSQKRATLAAYREPAGKLWQLCKVLYVFENKMQYLLIHAPYTSIGVFWHISNIPPSIS